MKQVLQNSAVPVVKAGANTLTPVVQQGAGLINALHGIRGNTECQPCCAATWVLGEQTKDSVQEPYHSEQKLGGHDLQYPARSCSSNQCHLQRLLKVLLCCCSNCNPEMLLQVAPKRHSRYKWRWPSTSVKATATSGFMPGT